MSDIPVTSSFDSVKEEVASIRTTIREIRSEKNDTTLGQYCKDLEQRKTYKPFKVRRTLKGHLYKLFGMEWSRDSSRIVSASMDGKLYVWNANTALKVACVVLRSSRVITCCFSPSAQFVASGGLDNTISVHKLSYETPLEPSQPFTEFHGFGGYLACCRYLGNTDDNILGCSGDSTCALWDVSQNQLVTWFRGHKGDVFSVAVSPLEPNTFASGSCDQTVRLWDVRTGKNVMTAYGHNDDINDVAYFPDGNAVVSGSDDGTCRLFDLRAERHVMCYDDNRKDDRICGITSVSFSRSGALLFAGRDEPYASVWDTLTGNLVQEMKGHDSRITGLQVAPDGTAVATCSWDTTLKIWA